EPGRALAVLAPGCGVEFDREPLEILIELRALRTMPKRPLHDRIDDLLQRCRGRVAAPHVKNLPALASLRVDARERNLNETVHDVLLLLHAKLVKHGHDRVAAPLMLEPRRLV